MFSSVFIRVHLTQEVIFMFVYIRFAPIVVQILHSFK